MAGDTAASRPSRGPRHAPRKKRKRRSRKSFFRRFWWAFVVVPVVAVLGVLGVLAYVYSHLELPATPPPLQTTYVFDRNGDQIAAFHAAVDRTIVPFSDMPQSLRDAVIATEDKDFYQHPGIDPIGILRAAWNDLIAHKLVQGGSTITQQLVKNVYAGHYETDPKTDESTYVVPPRTFGQKVREALLAIKVEQTFTKDQILAKYLNTIYFGHGSYGVEAAALTYFGVHARDLTPLQSATLAALVANPGYFDPGSPDTYGNALSRRNFVVDRMVAEGYVDAATAAEMKAKPIRVPGLAAAGTAQSFPPKLGYYLDYTRRALIHEYDEAMVFGGGLRVTTGLDPAMQHAAVQAVKDRLDTPGDPEAAVVAIDPSTGEVLAMYGGKNWQQSQVNLATGDGGTGRQAGSAFKPFTLTAAMEDRISLSSRWSGPGTITIKDPACYTNGQPWTLSNASDEESGTFTLREATWHSVNTVFAQLASQVGPSAVADVAHRMGITSPLEPVCSITLGTQAVDPLEMTNAYATLAAQGVRRWATPLHEVDDASGGVLKKNGGKGKQVIDPNDANLVTDALRGVIASGTGTNAQIGRPAAGKTGTAQDYVDAWFCGYVPQLAACVWVGYPESEEPLQNVEGFPAVYGGTIPALIWHDFMLKATQGMDVLNFPAPSTTGYTGGPLTPPPTPAPSKSPKPSPSPSPSPTPSPSPSPTGSPSPSPTESPSPSPSPTATGPPPTPRSRRRAGRG